MKYAVYFALGDAFAVRDTAQRVRGSLPSAGLFFGMLTFLIYRGRSAGQLWWDLPLAIGGIYGTLELSSWLNDKWGALGWQFSAGGRWRFMSPTTSRRWRCGCCC